MYSSATWSPIRALYFSEKFYDGDLSWLPESTISNCKFMLPVYEFLFENKVQFFEGNSEPNPELYRPGVNDDLYKDSMRNDLRIFRTYKKYVSISIIQSNMRSDKDFKNLYFDIEKISNQDIIQDLGDSRNFENPEDIIEKLKILQQSYLYFGSQCSWKNYADLFDIPAITIWMK